MPRVPPLIRKIGGVIAPDGRHLSGQWHETIHHKFAEQLGFGSMREGEGGLYKLVHAGGLRYTRTPSQNLLQITMRHDHPESARRAIQLIHNFHNESPIELVKIDFVHHPRSYNQCPMCGGKGLHYENFHNQESAIQALTRMSAPANPPGLGGLRQRLLQRAGVVEQWITAIIEGASVQEIADQVEEGIGLQRATRPRWYKKAEHLYGGVPPRFTRHHFVRVAAEIASKMGNEHPKILDHVTHVFGDMFQTSNRRFDLMTRFRPAASGNPLYYQDQPEFGAPHVKFSSGHLQLLAQSIRRSVPKSHQNRVAKHVGDIVSSVHPSIDKRAWSKTFLGTASGHVVAADPRIRPPEQWEGEDSDSSFAALTRARQHQQGLATSRQKPQVTSAPTKTQNTIVTQNPTPAQPKAPKATKTPTTP